MRPMEGKHRMTHNGINLIQYFKPRGHFFQKLADKQSDKIHLPVTVFVFENKAKTVQDVSERVNLLLGSGNCMFENQK